MLYLYIYRGIFTAIGAVRLRDTIILLAFCQCQSIAMLDRS